MIENVKTFYQLSWIIVTQQLQNVHKTWDMLKYCKKCYGLFFQIIILFFLYHLLTESVSWWLYGESTGAAILGPISKKEEHFKDLAPTSA